MTGWGAWVVPVAALTLLLLLDLGRGGAGQGSGAGVVRAGGGGGHRGRHSKWSYRVEERSETRRHHVPWRTPVAPPRHPAHPRAGPPYRPDTGGTGNWVRGGVRSGVVRGSRREYNAPSRSWGGVRGGRQRGGGRGRGRRPSVGTATSTLSIAKYTDKYKTWRGLVHGESPSPVHAN